MVKNLPIGLITIIALSKIEIKYYFCRKLVIWQ